MEKYVSVAAIVLAASAFVLSFIQFVSRHRPYLNISQLSLERSDGAPVLILEIQNLGPIPARLTWIDVEFPRQTESQFGAHRFEIGDVSPTHSVSCAAAAPGDIDSDIESTQTAQVNVRLDYRGSRLWGLKWIKYSTFQPLWFGHQTFGARRGEQAVIK